MRTRDKIVNLLASNPMTMSELASSLNIQRQLVYYHIKLLLREGFITVKDVVTKNGRYRSKVYSLRRGTTLVTITNPRKIQDTLVWLENYYVKHVKNLSKHTVDKLRHEFILFMYQIMRACSELVGVDQYGLLRTYGEKFVTDVIAPLVETGSKQSNMELFKNTVKIFGEIADSSPSIFSENTTQCVVQLKNFLGSGRYDSRIDEFVFSALQTAAKIFMKGKVSVEKFPQSRLTSYTYLVKRIDVKKF